MTCKNCKNANVILQMYFIPNLTNIILSYRDENFKRNARQYMKLLTKELQMRSSQLDDGAIVFKTSYVQDISNSKKYIISDRKVFGRVMVPKIPPLYIHKNCVRFNYMAHLQRGGRHSMM